MVFMRHHPSKWAFLLSSWACYLSDSYFYQHPSHETLPRPRGDKQNAKCPSLSRTCLLGQGLAIAPRPDEKGGSWKNLICNPLMIMIQPLGGSLFALEAK